MDETPTRGKGVGGQSYDHLTTYALLGHNAHAILGESAGIRGTKHDEFWHAFQAGELPPPPKVPFVFEKFRAFLNAAGVDTQQRGNTLHYLPMSETRVRAQSNGEIKEGTLIKSKDLAEEKNGLFDPAITGGLTGDKFAHIELNERIPQPLYEKTIRDVLGLKTAEYYGLIAHTKFWNTVTKKFQDEASRDTLTGEEAFKNLMNFNIANKLEEAKRGLRTAVGSDANKLNRAARYLRGLQETKLTPFDAYMTKAVAVLPPKYRPIIEMSGGALRVADSNLMYRDVILTNDALAQAKAANMPADALATARTTLYQSVGALIGVNNALTHRDDREDAQGLIDTIKGKSNKTGMFQRLIVAHRNDYSGRSTIEPDANLGVDEIGIPEEMAWKLYKPMIVRRLSQLGNKPSDAMEAVEKRTLAARQALDEEMKNRPVLYNRAPSLHRWSVAAAFPRISAGKEIKISPLVVGPLGADFDGNCCIGQTTLTLTFDGISSMDMLQEKYAMRAIGSTKLLSTTPDGLIVLMAIQDVPRTGAGMRDKNGAMVYAVKPGISVLSALPGGGTRFSAVTGVTVEDGCSLMEVVTNGKNSVIVSDNESLVVFDRHTGGILKQKPRAAVDDLVPVVRQFPATEEGTERDYRFGWMFGAFCGDGFFMGGSRRLGFTKLDAPTRNQFEEAMAEFTSASWSGQYAGLKGEDKLGASLKDHYYGDCSVFENCYADVGTFTLEDRACLRKKLPCVMGMDRQFRLGMLAGLLDTDGTVTEVKAASKEKSQLQVMFATSSPYLRDDVIDLCMSLGIRASFTTTKPSSKRLQTHDSYTLSISAVDVKIIAGELRLTCEQKKAVLRKIEVYKFRDSTDPVPVPWKLFDYIRDAKGIFINHQSMLTTLRSLKGKHPFPRVSRETARTVLQVLEKNDLIKENSVFSAWRDIVRDTTVGWERVLSATPKPTERVYDLVIPETKIFAVNGGLIIYDTMSVIPPITEAARLESFKLLPSRNLLFDKDRSLAYGASKDVISGIFALTKPGLPSGKKYESTDAAIAAYHANKDGLLLGSLVTVANRSTPVAIGWLILEKIVPARFLGAVSAPIDGKKLDKILTDIATQSPTDYNTISRQLTQAGFQFAAAAGGITSTIGELNVDRTKIDRLLNQMEHSIAAAGPDKTDRIAAAKKSYDAINPQLEEEVKSHLKTINRGYHSFIESGSNDKKVNQMMQMLASPVMMADIHDQIVPAVVKSSYAQGMRPSDYVLTTPGSRKGLVARSLSTALPGFLAKEVAGNVGDVRIYDKDCNTTRGIEEPLKAPNGLKDHDVDLLDRHLLRDILGTSFKRNDPVTPGLLAQLRDKSVQTIWVRSPMTCQAAKPPCQMCAGRAPTGELWPIGTNIGYNYGQGISERSTQLTMKCSAGLITLATGEVYPFSEFFSRLKSVEEKDMRTAKDGIPALKGRKGEVKALSAQQHPPHDDVYLISTKTGSAMLVQGNHPLFVHPGRVRKNFSNRNLSLIGDERYRQTQAGTRDSNVAFHGELKEMQARDVSTENAIWVDYAPTVVRGTVTPSIDGYLAGYYASEGCIRYGNGTPKYKGVAVATCIALKGNTVIGLKNQARVEKALHGLSYGISGDVINIYSPSFASKIAALVGSHVMPRGVGQSPSNAKVLLGGFSNYADQWLKDFLDGMIDGDGTIFESSGSTVVKICTTSFELATQIMFVARKFDLRSSISATDKSPCRLPQWNTAFNVELRFPKGYVSTSHRVEVMGGIKPMKRKMLRPIRGFDPVSQVKKLTQWRGFVYDVKTSTSEFMLGTIQNHNTFHAGGTVGAGDALMEGFNRLRELLSVPDVIKKQGTLATVNGRVEETRLAPQGGYFVYIGDKRVEHHVQQGRDLIVKNGDVVSAGDPLSTGNFKPQEIAEHKGTLAAQQYVVNQIRRSYQDAGAVVRKPVIEVLAAAMMRTVEVTNDGGEPDLAIGDVIHENDYENRKKRNQKITAKPTLLGLSHKPLQSKDLLARLNFQRLDDAIRDIPSAGGSSDLTGAGSPISGLAYGAAFRPEADSAFNAGVKY
jgi:DNA-directed RNA polymerase beta' subunit